MRLKISSLKSSSEELPPIRDLATLALFLALGTVAWEHGFHAAVLREMTDTLPGHLIHIARDALLALPLSALALTAGLLLARYLGIGRTQPFGILGTGAIVSILLIGLMALAVDAHGISHQWLESDGVSSTTLDASHSHGHSHGPSQVAGQKLSDEQLPPFIHGVRDALVGQVAALPLALLSLILLLKWENRRSSPVYFYSRARPYRQAYRIAFSSFVILSLLPLQSSQSSLAGMSRADAANPCDGVPDRTYDISAIQVPITLNRFGDHDPNGYMYVLNDKIADVYDQINTDLPDRVSAGLRKDAIQPLVIRANLGECVQINFTNQLVDGPASLHIDGLAYAADSGGSHVGYNSDNFANHLETITYNIPIPTDPNAERGYYFHDHGASRNRIVHGLFGALVVEPAGSVHLDPESGAEVGAESGWSNWEAIIVPPEGGGPAFREFVLMYHEIGDENYDGLRDGNNQPIPVLSEFGTYRPAGRGINYRSEPFRDRLLLKADKSQGYSSYAYGDPATPIPRSYLGEPTKTRLMHGGSEVFHVHHLHGGGDRWPRNPKAVKDADNPGYDQNKFISSGLTKIPLKNAHTTRLDSQSIGPGTSYNLEHECGAGGCQQAAGDFLYHCHIGHHYLAGMWSFWRVFDTQQADLAPLPVPALDPPAAVRAYELIGREIEGKIIGTDISLEEWVESQLPPQGVRFNDEDATVWDWIMVEGADGPIYLGEPEDSTEWANYRSPTPGERPEILFNPINGRYTWPLMRPHLGKRPPFSPNGHSGAPWLGEQGSADRPDGLCPGQEIVPDPGRQRRYYPITAIKMPIQLSPTEVDDEGRIFALNEEKSDVRNGVKPAQPLAIRSNVGDCVNVILTSELEDDFFSAGHSKVNMHIHFVQFDPQASDGVITGFSFEQSVRPYATEDRILVSAAAIGDTTIEVSNVDNLRPGIWIGIGLGEGMCTTGEGSRPCTEIRRIQGEIVGTTLTLDRPLDLAHAAGQAVGVEFVQYEWYSDVDTGTVFWHDHVNFKSWDHGLFGAHIIEPAGSTYHDPQTGAEVRSGTIVDVRTPSDASVGAGQNGSFRELMLFHHNRTASRPDAPLDQPGSTFNLRAEPTQARGGDPAYIFSSVTHGDPVTPLPRAYVSDPFVIRHLGVVERVGGVRVTGHRFSLERWAEEGALTDTSPLGISERFDLVLDKGAGGAGGMPGDYLYYSTKAREFMAGGWGIIRVHDTKQGDLQPLPGRDPPNGNGFPDQTHTGEPPDSKGKKGKKGKKDKICPPNAPVRAYDVDITSAYIVGNDQPLQIHEGYAYVLSKGPGKTHKLKGKALVREPLVLRVNHGECLEVNLHNRLDENASLSIGKLPFDPQSSYGAAIGFNLDSTVEPNKKSRYEFYADKEIGTSYMFNLANPASISLGAFAAVIVEPAGASYLDPYSGQPLKTGVVANIVGGAGGDFREVVTLFHDLDKEIGQSRMPYPTQVAGFTGINYAAVGLDDRLSANPDRSLVFDSDTHGDPRLVFEAHSGDEMTFRVASPWAEQMHVFGMEGHRWPLEPRMAGAEQVFSQLLAPGFAFDAPLIGGAGGDYGETGDYLFSDQRLPFMEAGLWGQVSVLEPNAPQLQVLGSENPAQPLARTRGQMPASVGAIVKAVNALKKDDQDPRITLNTTVLDVNLEPGAERGTVTQPLLRGTIRSTGNTVYFVLSDASDADFAAEYGIIFSRGLADLIDHEGGAQHPAVEYGTTLVESADGPVWGFEEDPGRVNYLDENGTAVRALTRDDTPNPVYSPLKEIDWRGRKVIVNVPFVKWGDEPGQKLIIDEGGCNPLIRINRPSPFFVGDGPPECTSDEQPIDRYFGGKVMAIDIEPGCDEQPNNILCASVTAKLEVGTHRPDIFPYYTVWEASKPPPSEFMGVIFAPKLGLLSPADEFFNVGLGNRAVAHIAQFANGVFVSGGGPLRFQPGLTSYSRIEDDDYSPMWHITMLFFDCDFDGTIYAEARNRSFGAVPGVGLEDGHGKDEFGIERFDPAIPADFDPFGMHHSRMNCVDINPDPNTGFLANVNAVTGNDNGFIYIEQLEELKALGYVAETQAPPGWLPIEGSPVQNPLLVNCPAPVSVDLNKMGGVSAAGMHFAKPNKPAQPHSVYMPLLTY